MVCSACSTVCAGLLRSNICSVLLFSPACWVLLVLVPTVSGLSQHSVILIIACKKVGHFSTRKKFGVCVEFSFESECRLPFSLNTGVHLCLFGPGKCGLPGRVGLSKCGLSGRAGPGKCGLQWIFCFCSTLISKVEILIKQLILFSILYSKLAEPAKPKALNQIFNEKGYPPQLRLGCAIGKWTE